MAVTDFVRLSMDTLVRDMIQAAFAFRFIVVDYRTAMQVESIIEGGRLGAGRPRLNASRPRRAAST